jgi:hypothetical protein
MEVRELFSSAIINSCIVQKDLNNSLSNKFECVITEEFSMNNFLAGYNMGLEDSQRTNFTEVRRCLADLRKLINQGLPVVSRRDIFESFDEEAAKDSFLRSPEHIKLIRKEINKRRVINDKINELSEIISSVEKEEVLYSDFIEAMYTNTICKKGALYVYDKDETEKEEWSPFVNLMKSKEYVEWLIFKNFTQLDEKHRLILKKKAEKRAEILASSEDISSLLNTITNITSNYKGYTDSLEYKRYEMVDGDEINSFYLKLYDKLSSIKNSIA